MAMENLLENNLFLSLLSQGGASIAGPDSVAAGVNPILQQTIAAQSKTKEQQRQMELMSKLFGKGVDMKSDAKGGISINAETIEALSSLLGGEGGASGLGTLKEEGATGLAPDTTQIQPGQGQGQDQGSGIEMLRNLLNPPASSPDVPAYSDLVGLTTKDISEALAGAQKTEVMKQSVAKSAADRRAAAAKAATDTEYKQALTKQAKATTKKTLAGLEEGTLMAPIEVPGKGPMTLKQWNGLSSGIKDYAFYAFDAKQRGEEVMSKREFEKSDKKDSIPTTAMGAAIARYAEDHGELPPENTLKKMYDLYRPATDEDDAPITWTTATNNLTKRFGKLDPTGMWVVTPELQASHRLAQKALVELQTKEINPLRAINMAEEASRKYYSTIDAITEEANKIKDNERRKLYIRSQINKINRIFEEQIGFNPGE